MTDETMHDDQDPRSAEERRHDERLDALVRGLAVEYHRPGATPREEMWAKIAVGLSSGDVVANANIANRELSGIGNRESRSSRRLSSRMPRFVVYAMAASLLLAAGIGIGVKMSARGGETDVAQNAPTTVAPSAAPVIHDSAAIAASDTSPATTAARPAPSRMLADRDSRFPIPDKSRNAMPIEPNRRTAAYSVATVAHLAQVEALLTSYRGEQSNRAGSAAQQQHADAQLAIWARDLLTNTRLLLDSPAAVDPLRKRLLEDLELVLVQIVQLSPGTAADDRLLIERTLSREHVLTRLRTAIPAGQTSGT